jgi:hypothetical protein
MKKLDKGTIIQAIVFIAACILSVLWFGWKLIPILILFGWSNDIAIVKALSESAKKQKEQNNE